MNNQNDAVAISIAKSWGWDNPGDEIIETAKLSARITTLKSGEALVELGFITKDKLQSMIEQKPVGTRTLDWIAQNDPGIRAQIEKVLALRVKYAFYDSLELLSQHKAMEEGSVVARCDELNAVLMNIEDSRPVLVFSAYNDMLRYTTTGHEERNSDAIRKSIGDMNLLVAVAKPDQVTSNLALARSKDSSDISSNIIAMWYGSTATDKYEKTIARILDYGLSNNITDIAITPELGSGSVVEMRRLLDMVPCPVADHLTVEEASKIIDFLMAKSGANPGLARVREPRDGNIIYRSSSGDAELRLSFIPVNQPGEYLISVSMRLMARTENAIELKKLNIADDVIEQISSAAILTKGMILVVGGTNTGKSTTVAGALEENFKKYGKSRKRLSLEKPVERRLRGVLQVNVPPTMEKAFDTYLEAFKRHDPDVIFIGEILGQTTANAAVTAATSGHLVLTTTHANDTLLGYDSVAQMLDPNKRYQFIESLELIVAQDMVRGICQACGKVHKPTEDETSRFNSYCKRKGLVAELPEMSIHIDPAGCKVCKFTGVSEILPINEVLPVNVDVKNAMFGMLGNQVIGNNGENRRDIIASARTSTLFNSAFKLVQENKIELGDAIR